MEIERLDDGDSTTLRLKGRLDSFWADSFDAELSKAVREGGRTLRVDMAAVEYVSSAGLRVFVKASRQLDAVGGRVQIVNPSGPVMEVLRITGFDRLVAVAAAAPEPAVPHDEGPRESFFLDNPAAGLSCRAAGCFTFAAGGGDGGKLEIGRSAFAFGVGALGEGRADCEALFGEFVGAFGNVAYQPSGPSRTPDYLLAAEGLSPDIWTYNHIVCEGAFSTGFFFEGKRPRALSELAALALAKTGGGMTGMLVAAEVDGLVGASFKRSPASVAAGVDIFAFPEIREWLAFTPEKLWRDHLAVLCGLVDVKPHPLSRPLGPGLWGRFGAAVFSFRLLRRDCADPAVTVGSLFSEEKLFAVLRPLNDDRPLGGAGESCFSRGCCWAAPVREFNAEGVAP